MTQYADDVQISPLLLKCVFVTLEYKGRELYYC
jgi:hypothetical protein